MKLLDSGNIGADWAYKTVSGLKSWNMEADGD